MYKYSLGKQNWSFLYTKGINFGSLYSNVVQINLPKDYKETFLLLRNLNLIGNYDDTEIKTKLASNIMFWSERYQNERQKTEFRLKYFRSLNFSSYFLNSKGYQRFARLFSLYFVLEFQNSAKHCYWICPKVYENRQKAQICTLSIKIDF